VQAVDVDLAALALRDEVILAQELLRGFAECLFGFDFAVAELAAKLEVPVLRDLFGSGEAVFLGGPPAVFPAEVGGALPVAAVRTFGPCRPRPCGVPSQKEALRAVSRYQKGLCNSDDPPPSTN